MEAELRLGFPCWSGHGQANLERAIHAQKGHSFAASACQTSWPSGWKSSGVLRNPSSLAPRTPCPSPVQTTGRSKKPSRHRPGWTRFRSLITTRKLKKGCYPSKTFTSHYTFQAGRRYSFLPGESLPGRWLIKSSWWVAALIDGLISCRESVLGVKNIPKTGEGETYYIKSFFLLSVFSILPPTDTWYWCQNMHFSTFKQN
uniref:uncharacterized protein LOC118525078 n=1 Tax=Halichoerus grypus TaxID=9711 RepID=UPI0016594B11|nr:uncharacterized protein LOC118525078 [Halichoerus grypus]